LFVKVFLWKLRLGFAACLGDLHRCYSV